TRFGVTNWNAMQCDARSRFRECGRLPPIISLDGPGLSGKLTSIPPVGSPPQLEKRMFRLLSVTLSAVMIAGVAVAEEPAKAEAKKVEVGAKAPEFKIKDSSGKVIDLAELTAKGPVLLRLTCGCSGCDKELAYFQAVHEAYKDKGLTSVAVFKEPDA